MSDVRFDTDISGIAAMLEKYGEIVIFPHISIDGDGLGSSLAFGLALEKKNKSVRICLDEEIPCLFEFLPGRHLIELFDNSKGLADVKKNAHPSPSCAMIALDTGDTERLGKRADMFGKCPVTLNIDHHATNTKYALYNYVRPDASAAGEIVYDIIREMGVDVDEDMATCLYVAIATDTGGFRFSNTTPAAHRIAADLIGAGVDVALVSQQVFDSISYEKLKLLGMAANSLELLEDRKIAVMVITDGMMQCAGAKEEDSEGIINFARNIRGVEAAILLRELSGGEVRVNLRSNFHADVSEIARKYMGGGHKRAAGCTVKGSLEEIKHELVREIKKQL